MELTGNWRQSSGNYVAKSQRDLVFLPSGFGRHDGRVNECWSNLLLESAASLAPLRVVALVWCECTQHRRRDISCKGMSRRICTSASNISRRIAVYSSLAWRLFDTLPHGRPGRYYDACT